jgi:pSer/pThr/pTyr-binding forkhead associated (FHA) protein
MLRSTRQYAVVYDVIGLAHSGLVTVGRESDASVRLDSAEIPFLLSRKHCTLQVREHQQHGNGKDRSMAAHHASPASLTIILSPFDPTMQFQPDGRILLCDLGSTNGTYAARDGMPLRKLASNSRWELRDGDTVGFGGPEVIVVSREHVNNPFIFKFYAGHEEVAEEMEEEAVRPSRSDLQVRADVVTCCGDTGTLTGRQGSNLHCCIGNTPVREKRT